MSKEIEVVWWGGQRGSWCHALPEFLLQGFTHRMHINEVQGDGAIVVVKSDQFQRKSQVEEFHLLTVRLHWMLLIVTANEDIGLPMPLYERTSHFRKWLQTPHRYQLAHRYLPWGWTPGCSIEVHSRKDWPYFFSGQITHERRKSCIEALKTLGPGPEVDLWFTTDGFAKGMPQEDYYRMMGASKVVPCPSGPITVDSLRVCEALQLGAVPVLDTVSPTGPYPEYWERVFPSHPFEVISEWRMFPYQLAHILKNWDVVSEVVSGYWRQWKANLQISVIKDLKELGAL